MALHTLVLPYVLESELVAIVLALDYANLSESAFAYHTQEPEVVKID
jgi:hypothetical protein